MGDKDPVEENPGGRRPVEDRRLDPNRRMAVAIRSFWLRQAIAAVVYFAVAFPVAKIVPRSWPVSAQAPFIVVPLVPAVLVLVVFRRRDEERERARHANS
jgi:hypothetical protein